MPPRSVTTRQEYQIATSTEFLHQTCDFDPDLALDGGDDGLDCYRKIANDVSDFLKDNAFLILEIGQNMENDIIDIFEENGLKFVKYAKDLNAIIRCLIFTKQ